MFKRSFGIGEFSCLNLGIRDFKEKSGRDSGLKLSLEVACRKKRNIGITWLHEMWSRDYGIEEPYWELPIQSINVAFIHVCTSVKSRSPIILFQNLNIIQLLISCCFFFSLTSNRCNDAFLWKWGTVAACTVWGSMSTFYSFPSINLSCSYRMYATLACSISQWWERSPPTYVTYAQKAGIDAMCGLRLLLVLSFASRVSFFSV